MRRVTRLKSVLWLIVGVGAAVIVSRLLTGLGAATNLSHDVSWGLWNAVKISIVPLSAGGFVLAGVVYIFHLEKYRPLLRVAILTSFLGYSTFATMLIFDLGIPYRIWHPMIYWQYHSVLFEVAWCVMLYLSVLALEFAPNALEHPWFEKPPFRTIYKLLKICTIPLVIAGIVLSTLHQSSLGGLFLIVPHRLDPLWYSPLINVLFLISAVGMGLLVVVVEAFLLQYFYGVEAPVDILAPLARAGAAVMVLFFLVRTIDQSVRGVLPSDLGASSMAWVFIMESILAVFLPLLLFSKRVRGNRTGLFLCPLSAVLGVVLYRSDVALLAINWGPYHYFPTWMEFALCLGVLAGSTLVFLFLIDNLDIYYGPARKRVASQLEPELGLAFESRLASAGAGVSRRYSMFALAGATLAVALLPNSAVTGAKPTRTPVFEPRTVEGSALARQGEPGRVLQLPEPQSEAGERESQDEAPRLPLLMIDGNRNGDMVLFDHAIHVERAGGDDACAVCHHLNMPLDADTSCWECHRDMYEPTSIFDHESHVVELGGNSGCARCHADPAAVKSYETATACAECHETPPVSDPIIKAPNPRWGDAVSYMDAMHGLCIKCHQKYMEQSPQSYWSFLDRCDNCHDADRVTALKLLMPGGLLEGRAASSH